MTKQQPWMKWYPADWRAHTKLKMCSLSARGLWIEMLGIMHESEPYGHLLIDGAVPNIRDLAAIIGRPEKEVIAAYAELQHRGVFSKTDSGVPFSRKMVRDRAKVIENTENGADGGNPNIPRGTVPKEARSRPFKRSDAPNKTLRIFEMHDGHCHWCATELLYRPDGGPAGFHVDHVLAICDGGTNAESNLVPACAQCNHDRARLDAVGRQQQADATVTAWNTGVMVGIASDSKAQIARYQNPESR
jgi:5-methylcytosine-specific restriction endonuclease McrA